MVVESMTLTSDGRPLGLYERRQKLADLGHRLERLEKKSRRGN
jgi:hypothetical protein